MDIMSAIYNKVRHRMTDDWAFANEMRKSYDYHSEESELKAAVERFHSRRYAKIHPQLAIGEYFSYIVILHMDCSCVVL